MSQNIKIKYYALFGHGSQNVRGIYAIRFAMKRMYYYILCFRQQFPFAIMKFIKHPYIN